MHPVASTPSAGCDGLWVQLLGGRPPDDRVHAGIPVYVRRVCFYFKRLGVELCVGFLCLLRACIVLKFGLVSSGLHCFLRLSSAGLFVVLVPGCGWPYSAFCV